MSRLRPVLVVALLVAAVGAAVATAVPRVLAHVEESRHEHAIATAARLTAPAGATTATGCADAMDAVTVACWQTDASVDDVSAVLRATLEDLPGEPVEKTCTPAPVPRGSADVHAQACFLILRQHGDAHGVFMAVTPRVEPDDVTGDPAVTGSVVNVLAD